MLKVVVLLSGKRKSGKDYCSVKLKSILSAHLNVSICAISNGLKLEYARIHGLDYDELISDGPYKERYRKAMITWGDEIRQKQPYYFCQSCLPLRNCDDVIIISDCRRASDIKFFQDRYITLTIRVESNQKQRESRGFTFVNGIDDGDSECALDKWIFDIVVTNDGNEMDLEKQLAHVAEVVKKLLK